MLCICPTNNFSNYGILTCARLGLKPFLHQPIPRSTIVSDPISLMITILPSLSFTSSCVASDESRIVINGTRPPFLILPSFPEHLSVSRRYHRNLNCSTSVNVTSLDILKCACEKTGSHFINEVVTFSMSQ
jgi:hypothetical protein